MITQSVDNIVYGKERHTLTWAWQSLMHCAIVINWGNLIPQQSAFQSN